METDFGEIRKEIAALRAECSNLAKEVAVLRNTAEQTDKVFEARMRAVVAETMSELKIRYAEQEAKLEREYAQRGQATQVTPNAALPPATGESRQGSTP
ncbi:MAG TPA: hypothetical protein VGB77_20665 [Abditibacteriaceae bacterium]|jgi:hypothetical protein